MADSMIRIEDTSPPQFPLQGSIQRAAVPSFSFSTHVASEEDDDEGPPDGKPDKSSLNAPPTLKAKPKRVKVSVKPGFSQLDWGKLQKSGQDLRNGITSMQRITPAELASHKSKTDCWQAYNGKVYDVTAFLPYHPGGVPEMMRAAGKDGTELFMRTHAWVNVDYMLDGCLIGFLVRE